VSGGYERPLHNLAAEPKHFARWQHPAAPAQVGAALISC
jgi:hypothetical protein